MTGPVVGIIGGGQLARMLAEAAAPLGLHIRVLAAPGDEGASDVVPDLVVGRADDPDALRSFAATVDVLTIDHENVDHRTIAELESEGFAVRPSLYTMRFSDKAHQRTEFAAAGLPVPDFAIVDTPSSSCAEEMSRFADRHGGRLVAKASRGGYDGRGVWMLERDEIGAFAAEYSGAPLVLEPRLPLDLELAVVVARRPSGEIATWPVVETVQVDGMCNEVIQPASIDSELHARSQELAHEVAEVTDAVGVLAVELFVLDGELLINEIAPRVHNSGHITSQSCATSQFEQHLRAILDWPLGSTSPLANRAVMVNVVGAEHGDPRLNQALALAEVPEAHIHLYGKTPRPGRKIGHVTLLGDDVDELRVRAGRAAGLLGGPPT